MRLVVLPEWQGIGIGSAFLNEVCRLHLEGKGRCGRQYSTYFNTSHPQLCNSLRRQKGWIQRSATLYGCNKARNIASLKKSKQDPKGGYGGHFRAIQGFKYVGIQGNE